ncbi:MAG: phosphate acyltransferase PlsX [bacterium]|jgi:glycerol-3-phosphate acyltransferase PlsX|nr:phosphate acyltransferase PlsX [bacterium]
MRVVVDAMGGDRAPGAVIEGIKQFVAEKSTDLDVVVVGRQDVLEEACSGLPVTIVHAPDVVGMHESPSVAVKTRPHSSIAVAMSLLKQGKADALISMGHSGATVAFGVFGLGRMNHLLRPAIVAPMPTQNGYSLVLDVGAVVDCKPAHLLQFAAMGSVYSRSVFGVDNPKVGILSIGEEESKGNELTFETAKLLKKAPLNFIGNIEGVDIMRGTADVVVCDGFVGNIILKFGEGLVELFARALKLEAEEVLSRNVDSAHRGALLKETMQRVDYTAYGGALLLGLKGHCLIGHGRSNPRAIANGIRAAGMAASKCPSSEIQKALDSVQSLI